MVKITENVDEPTPDMHLLNLWAERHHADVHANRHPWQLYARTTANSIAAQVRCYEKQIPLRRLQDWFASLHSSTGN